MYMVCDGRCRACVYRHPEAEEAILRVRVEELVWRGETEREGGIERSLQRGVWIGEEERERREGERGFRRGEYERELCYPLADDGEEEAILTEGAEGGREREEGVVEEGEVVGGCGYVVETRGGGICEEVQCRMELAEERGRREMHTVGQRVPEGWLRAEEQLCVDGL